VTLTVTDVNGNSATGTATVTVVDNIAPVITGCKTGTIVKFVDKGAPKYTVQGTEFDVTATDNCTMQSLTYTLTGVTLGFGTTLAGVQLNKGVTTITWTATDIRGNSSTCSYSVNVTKRQTQLIVNSATNPVITPTTNAIQYSDNVSITGTLKYNAADYGQPVDWEPLDSKPVTFAINTQSITPTTGTTGSATGLLQVLQAPSTYNVNGSFAGDDFYEAASNSLNNAVVVNQENAKIDYTGDVIKATSSATATSAVITLRANISDITAALGDPQYDAYPGDIRNAKVKFVLRGTTDVDITPTWIPVTTLINNSDTKVGTVSFNWTVNLPTNASDVEQTVGIIVDNGYYIRNSQADNIIVTVYQPNGDFITGGGFITTSKSTGLMKGDNASKTNFGFNVKFNKKGTQLQGNLNFIFRRTESIDNKVHVYQVKSNSMLSLGVNATNAQSQTANYLAKCNITDITDPANPIAVNPGGGVKFMYVNMVDNGEPGSNDLISFVLVGGSGTTPDDPTVLSNIVYSSNWTGTRTDMMNLTGGNLVVHSGFNLGSSAVTLSANPRSVDNVPTVLTTMDVKAYPNPTTYQFNVKLESSNVTEPISIIVYNASGTAVETRKNLAAGQTIQIGGLYRPGVYIMEMIQGNQHKQLKLVKIPD
jgi:hypothetical protein